MIVFLDYWNVKCFKIILISKLFGNYSIFFGIFPNMLEMALNCFQIIWKISKLFGNDSIFFGIFPIILEMVLDCFQNIWKFSKLLGNDSISFGIKYLEMIMIRNDAKWYEMMQNDISDLNVLDSKIIGFQNIWNE